MDKNKLEFTDEELKQLKDFQRHGIKIFKKENKYNVSYDKFFTKIGFHKLKKKFTKLLQDNDYFFKDNGHSVRHKSIQDGYFTKRESIITKHGNPFNVLYITDAGIFLLFDLINLEIEKRENKRRPWYEDETDK